GGPTGAGAGWIGACGAGAASGCDGSAAGGLAASACCLIADTERSLSQTNTYRLTTTSAPRTAITHALERRAGGPPSASSDPRCRPVLFLREVRRLMRMATRRQQ